MKHNEVIKISDDMMAAAAFILQNKNKDYSVDEDALAGFKFAARDAGITNYQAWLIFARKHWGAIATFCRNGGQLESEPIEERLKDMINYCTLLKCLIEDEKINKIGYEITDCKISINEIMHRAIDLKDPNLPKVDSNPNAFNSNVSR